MRIGRTSIVHFGSQLIATVVGFVATIYFARRLGADTLGVYFLTISVYLWVEILASGGIQSAVTKRLSEGEKQARRLTAALLVATLILVLFILGLFAFADTVERYLGASVVPGLILLTVVGTAFSLLRSVLNGEKKVHVQALLTPVDRIARAALQIGLVVAGSGLAGLLYGYFGAMVVAIVVGAFFVSTRFTIPCREDFVSILSYAKYAWLNGINTRAFASTDTIVLGFFVSSTLIGVYEIAWNVASILAVFGSSISQAVFPEISSLSADDEVDRATSLISDALAFTGLFTIPGLVGGLILGEWILGIYGSEFRQGSLVLAVLITARLLSAYQWQFINALGALDHPDRAFRINLAFLVLNVVLNVVLIYFYGWIGAAIATTLSAAVTLVLGYRSLQALIDVPIPYDEIGRQVVAAGAMGTVIYVLSLVIEVQNHTALLLVGLGAAVYFVVLTAISNRFRTTVLANISPKPTED